ncbi:CDP-diacylglycerol--glycerol-3-phosphate 3-phosphatidyltransferase [Lachnotalea glycerini]|uniref:CDP-diacylglycerol--glycerol-3-phosphate 3-phosphatidyltransferase n=1 Tax=Lachnotalea glycerini TaxID=1763509 RepID=A0A255IP95_9FIRM|nr:CDP-diacylglycerol--glycerol-3-phosphate 3-phosphatidyltransferase [Lachnotalea glycerini]PXV96034.1 CDP-diacylglycerol--glycerol-3-phosphate 3-phosphatidyltransferase [Lachnotalea glycerini]RDY30568.1 CDP-diacylglycerol--glycerol-3-phosphate 3-phosphatidyltransferase [Lachnotalea glycerini]
MNLPNKLTLLRVIMIPFFLVFMLTDLMGENGKYIALTIFALASFTDFLDGYIARKQHLVTNFGKFMDPLADKLLVCSTLIAFIQMNKISSVIVIIIVSRELIISGFRVIAADNGVVLAASYWGKFKTASQMVMIILLILDIQTPAFALLENIFIYLALILTIVSLIDYLIKNLSVLSERSNK